MGRHVWRLHWMPLCQFGMCRHMQDVAHSQICSVFVCAQGTAVCTDTVALCGAEEASAFVCSCPAMAKKVTEYVHECACVSMCVCKREICTHNMRCRMALTTESKDLQPKQTREIIYLSIVSNQLYVQN